jgi:hypothetical protein
MKINSSRIKRAVKVRAVTPGKEGSHTRSTTRSTVKKEISSVRIHG